MAVLTEAERAGLWVRAMREASAEREPLPLTKAELRAAIDASDQWIEQNAVAFSQALPAAARSGLTAGQKARVFLLVARRRFEREV